MIKKGGGGGGRKNGEVLVLSTIIIMGKRERGRGREKKQTCKRVTRSNS